MKTRFVLHGGFTPGRKQQDDAFFKEMIKGAPEETKILLVYFAEPDEKIQLRTEQDKEELVLNRGSKVLKFKVASEATFREDCMWADVIYLHGGKTLKIMESLSKYSNIGQIFLGKTIAADSAGVNSLGVLFYSNNAKKIGKGLGVLPFKIGVHYQDGSHHPLLDVEPDLDPLLLREYETRVIEI